MKLFTQVQLDLYTWVPKDELIRVLRDNMEPYEKVPSVSFSLICMEKLFYGQVEPIGINIVPVTLGLDLLTPIVKGTVSSVGEQTHLNIVMTMTRFTKVLFCILLILSAVSFFFWLVPMLLGSHPIVNIINLICLLFFSGVMFLRFRWNVMTGREKLEGIWTGLFEKERMIRKR
jgi:hypothetical protein